jgi:hypothetical protein
MLPPNSSYREDVTELEFRDRQTEVSLFATKHDSVFITYLLRIVEAKDPTPIQVFLKT